MSELPLELATERKEWHKLEAIMGGEVELCPDCNGPLEKMIDEVNGIEWVCKNPDCVTNNY